MAFTVLLILSHDVGTIDYGIQVTWINLTGKSTSSLYCLECAKGFYSCIFKSSPFILFHTLVVNVTATVEHGKRLGSIEYVKMSTFLLVFNVWERFINMFSEAANLSSFIH